MSFEPTDKQINYIVWQVNSARGLSDELKESFPDDIREGANYWKDNLEQKLKSITRITASEIIQKIKDDEDFTYLIEQLNQINR